MSLVTCDLCVFVWFQGLVSIAGKAHKVMLQGVHELYELNETPQLWEENLRINRLVFIGEDTHTSFTYLSLHNTTVKAAISMSRIKSIKMALVYNLLLKFLCSMC